MYMSEHNMIVADALTRIGSVLNASPMAESRRAKHPADASVKLCDVHFSYDGQNKVIRGVSFKIGSGQTVALVGPSGGDHSIPPCGTVLGQPEGNHHRRRYEGRGHRSRKADEPFLHRLSGCDAV